MSDSSNRELTSSFSSNDDVVPSKGAWSDARAAIRAVMGVIDGMLRACVSVTPAGGGACKDEYCLLLNLSNNFFSSRLEV
eukprot:CAMPEP_0119012132 /NCGR_PEP_ID=MMETSP1176-20130426/6104_1 /TAXON_ID=265551 /ORGANISM="Synedropsis recta cf, Strain CCMP1620" /LENGTH=79 /DNA_ID=CAMNT_0006965041 /DNA_START=59 /DNA_END=298 /DNA_ORIENTATION=+